MSRIYWDTMLFIYWIEGHPEHSSRVNQLMTRMKARRDQLCTSAFTIGEALVGPYKSGQIQIANKIRSVLQPPLVEVLPYTIDTADQYASLRSQSGISSADAIHLACAAQGRVDLFMTNDQRLIGRTVPGIQFIAGMYTDLL
jgi:predicted nucleic acid-binding protein